jgi:hypothetical protein
VAESKKMRLPVLPGLQYWSVPALLRQLPFLLGSWAIVMKRAAQDKSSSTHLPEGTEEGDIGLRAFRDVF